MRFSDDFLEELKFRNDIESVVSRYVALKPRGRMMVGLCPFHNEKTPSFTVYTDSQSYYCFGCGAGGDCVTFIKTAENLDYAEAVRYLAERCGMSLPIDGFDDTVGRQRQRIYEANRLAARLFFSALQSPAGQKAREYLDRRGLSEETRKKFGLGYAPDTWDALVKHLKISGFGEDELFMAALARKTKNGGCIDLFRNRLMFPVIDLRGNVIAFSGRVLDDSLPKYINSPETAVYQKSRVLYALNLAKNNNNRRLILCEGNMDVIALHQAGFTNAVAAMGTAFTQGHAKLLSSYADEVLLAFDADEAGQKAVSKVMSVLASTTLRAKVIKMTGGKDPDEIIRKHGAERMRGILEGAVNETEFRLAGAAAGIDLGSPDGKRTYLASAVNILASINNAIERDIYITKISSELGVSKEAIGAEVAREIKIRQKYARGEEFAAAQKNISGHPKLTSDIKAHSPKIKLAEENLIRSLIRSPDFCEKINAVLQPEDFFTDIHRDIFYAVTELIRAGRSIDISSLSGELDDGGMSVLSRLINDRSVLTGSLGECLDYVNALKEEKTKRNKTDPGSMPDEEFLKYIRDKGEKNEN